MTPQERFALDMLEARAGELIRERDKARAEVAAAWREVDLARRRMAELEEMGRAWQESDEHKHADELRGALEAARAEVDRLTQELAEVRLECDGQYEMTQREREIAKAEEAEVERLRAALREVGAHWYHSGLCCPVDDQGRMGAPTPESCVCDPVRKRVRAILAQVEPA